MITRIKEEKQREVALIDLLANLFVRSLQVTPPYTNLQISHANSLKDTKQRYFQYFTSLKKDVPAVLTQKLVYKLE